MCLNDQLARRTGLGAGSSGCGIRCRQSQQSKVAHYFEYGKSKSSMTPSEERGVTTVLLSQDEVRAAFLPAELALYNNIESETLRGAFIELVRQRCIVAVPTPEASRAGRNSVVSELTTSGESSSKDREKVLASAMNLVFKRWKFVGSSQVHYGGNFCEEVFEALGMEMEPAAWEGKNGLRSKAVQEISKKRAYLAGRVKDVFLCKCFGWAYGR
jgi:hypothetical protein